MSLKTRILGNTFVQFAGRLVTSFFGFATTVILASYLGPKGYGSYIKAFTLVSFFFLFIDFGLNAVYLRKFKDNLKAFSTLNATRTLFFLFSFLTILLILFITKHRLFSQVEKWYVILFIPTILLFGYTTSLNLIFQTKLRYELSVVASVIGSLVGLLLLIVALPSGILWIIVALVFGYLTTTILSTILAFKLTKFVFFAEPFLLSDFYLFIKAALPLGIMLFLNSVYVKADVFIVSAFQGNTAVGIYELAYKFFEFPLSFATFFANSVFPYYVTIFSSQPLKFQQVFRKANWGLLLSSIVFSLGTYLLAPWLTLIKPAYAESIIPLRILSLSFPIFFITSSLSWLVFLQKKEIHLIWIYGLSLLLNVAANIVFVPKYSYLAAAWVSFMGNIRVG
jgi:O-antigen/teichoic acid export membrane protein